MLIFNDTYQELQKQTEDYATQVSNEVMNGASLPSETDMQTHVFEIYHDILRNYLDQGMKYGDPETITVHVNKDDKMYIRLLMKTFLNRWESDGNGCN